MREDALSLDASLMPAKGDITDRSVVERLLKRLGQLEEMVENLQRKGNGSSSAGIEKETLVSGPS